MCTLLKRISHGFQLYIPLNNFSGMLIVGNRCVYLLISFTDVSLIHLKRIRPSCINITVTLNEN